MQVQTILVILLIIVLIVIIIALMDTIKIQENSVFISNGYLNLHDFLMLDTDIHSNVMLIVHDTNMYGEVQITVHDAEFVDKQYLPLLVTGFYVEDNMIVIDLINESFLKNSE